MKVIYIAGRYTAPDSWAIENNIRAAESLAFEVAKLGAMPLCPHTLTRFFHSTAVPTSSFWYEGTLELMVRCDAIILVPGWEGSNSVKLELVEAEARKMPVFDSLATLSDWLRVSTEYEQERGAGSLLRDFDYVVGGKSGTLEFDIRRTLGSIADEVLSRTGNAGRPLSEWEVRSGSGVLLEHNLLFGMVDTPGRVFFIQPKAGVSG